MAKKKKNKKNRATDQHQANSHADYSTHTNNYDRDDQLSKTDSYNVASEKNDCDNNDKKSNSMLMLSIPKERSKTMKAAMGRISKKNDGAMNISTNYRTLYLNEVDAQLVNIKDGDSVIVFQVNDKENPVIIQTKTTLQSSKSPTKKSFENEVHNNIRETTAAIPKTAAICSVKVISYSSDYKNKMDLNNKKKKKSPLKKSSIFTSYHDDETSKSEEEEMSQPLNIISSSGESWIAPSSFHRQLFSTEHTPQEEEAQFQLDADASKQSIPVITSPSKSSFSFARGGGGDSIISPIKSPSPIHSKNNKMNSNHKAFLLVIPIIPQNKNYVSIQKVLGTASSISLCLIDKDKDKYSDIDSGINHRSSKFAKVLERMVLASCHDMYIQIGDILTIYFQGRKLTYQIQSIEEDPRKLSEEGEIDLSRQLINLSINNNDSKNPSTMNDNCSSSNNDDDDFNSIFTTALKPWEKTQLSSNHATAVKDKIYHTILYYIDYNTEIKFVDYGNDNKVLEKNTKNLKTADQFLATKLVAGVDSILEEIISILLVPLFKPELFHQSGPIRAPRGLLLHGPSGTGKSLIASQVASQLSHYESASIGNGNHNRKLERKVNVELIQCATIQSKTSLVGEAERQITKLFDIAEEKASRENVSTLLVFDDIHLICPRRATDGSASSVGVDRVASTLLALLDGIGNNQNNENSNSSTEKQKGNIAVLAITSDASLLDPALRRPGRLDSEVEVPIPDDKTRAEIFKFLVERLHSHGIKLPTLSFDDWMDIARAAKGFTGADCMLSIKEALRISILGKQLQSTNANTLGISNESTFSMNLSVADLKNAIRMTKPSTIKSITVEVPRVPWSSIGGMEEVKRLLREAVELPLTHSKLFAALKIPPPRGVLLYGPPGCSKTLMARALATEGSMNFLAVKGPELLSKWLGESERALASLFRRARMASPCVIFFDEVDAIASKRGGSGESSGGGERLLSQLLTELDGIATYSSTNGHSKSTTSKNQNNCRVVVVGATNRPDLLDSALMRPGRIDRMIYVGLPDQASRQEILRISLRGKTDLDDKDMMTLAGDDVTGGFSGAELVAICREAALHAIADHEEASHSHDQTNTISTVVISKHHLIRSISGMKRQITPEMLKFYASFQKL